LAPAYTPTQVASRATCLGDVRDVDRASGPGRAELESREELEAGVAAAHAGSDAVRSGGGSVGSSSAMPKGDGSQSITDRKQK
jgi:hypothetical protein